MAEQARGIALWWRSKESTRTFWNVLLSFVGAHAILVGYATLWVTWLGPVTGLDTESRAFLPESVVETAAGYAVVSLMAFLAAAYFSGHRSKRTPGKVFFTLTSGYVGFALAYVWLNLRLPLGLNFRDTWLPISSTFIEPVLWPTYVAAALMAYRLTRPRPRPVTVSPAQAYLNGAWAR